MPFRFYRGAVGMKETTNGLTAKEKKKHRKNPESIGVISYWCGRRDLNSHGLPHTPLKRTRLPFRHSRGEANYSFGLAVSQPKLHGDDNWDARERDREGANTAPLKIKPRSIEAHFARCFILMDDLDNKEEAQKSIRGPFPVL